MKSVPLVLFCIAYTRVDADVLQALLWNVLTALLLAVASVLLTVLTLLAPRALRTIPLTYRQQSQGT